MPLTDSDISAIKQALQPDFEKTKEDIRQSLQPEFEKISKKIDRFRKENRKDHNLIMHYLDRQDTKLKKRIIKLEDHCGLPSPQ